ncbi:MAG: DNA primase [Lachnospiraceae bacterium]|nr:DNA primase [Lachnospiraceae bacterium]
MRYSEDLIQEIRVRNDIVSVISSYIKLTKKGGGYFGCCPFHNEKTPSFHVRPDRQTYHCFGCGVGGNVITFMMEYENYSFQEAVKALAERAGIALPEEEPDAEERKRIGLRQRLLDVNKEAATFYAKQLFSERGTRGREYFAGRRLSRDTMINFGLGYAPQTSNALYQYLKGKGYSDDIISQAGLAKITEKRITDRFWNRVMFPIMDSNRRVIGFGGRVMGDGEPKYLNSPETMLFDKSRNLYGLHLAKRSRAGYFLLCEGYMDVISMHQAGFDQAVASLGTSLTEGHAALIARYVKEVVLTYDSDGAGVKAAMRAIPILKAAGVNVRVLDLKPYKDPDEFIKALGAEAFQERIDSAVNGFLFETDVIRSGYDMNDPAEKTAFYRQIAGKLTSFAEELERENYLMSAAQRHGIPVEGLRDMVRRAGYGLVQNDPVPARMKTTPVRKTAGSPDKKQAGLRSAQIQVLYFGMQQPEAAAWVIRELRPEDFSDRDCSMLAADLFGLWGSNTVLDPAGLIDRYQENELLRNAAAEVSAAAFPGGSGSPDIAKLMKENVRRMKKDRIDRQLRDPSDAKAFQEALKEAARLEKPGSISDPPSVSLNGEDL